METLDSSREAVVRSKLSEPVRADRDYAVVASELLVDRLAGLRVRARAVRPAAPRSRRSPGTFAGTLREGRALGLPGPGGASLALPSEPSYDPWAWLVWGRELGNGTLDTAGGPSWKPGSVAVTVPLAPLGAELAPALWLLLVRAAGLLSLVLAARLAARLARAAGTSSAASNATAGALAAALLALSPGWWRYLAHGNEVPLALALGLGATELHPERPPARRLRADRARAAPAPPGGGARGGVLRLVVAPAGSAAAHDRHCRGVLALWLVPGGPVPATRSAPSAKRRADHPGAWPSTTTPGGPRWAGRTPSQGRSWRRGS